MRKILVTLAIASASVFTLAACSSSGWGQRGSQQSGDQSSGSTHTLTGGAEAAPTSEATPRPAGSSSMSRETGVPSDQPSGGTSGGGSGTGASEGGGSMGNPPPQPVQPTENMGSSAGPTGTQSGGQNPQQPGQ